MKWEEYFLRMAELVATKSKDPSTKVGAVITSDDHRIISTGFNGFPRGVVDSVEKGSLTKGIEERFVRTEKYEWTEHAERNAVYSSAHQGIALKGTTMYVTLFPCTDCTRAIIQSGIKKLVYLTDKTTSPMDWEKKFKISRTMLYEAGIKTKQIQL